MTTILDRFVTVFDFKTNTGRLNRLERRINKIQGKLDTMARGAGTAGAALTAGAGFAVRGFARYETELAKIEGLVGISRQQLAAWQDDIEEIGKATGKSPVELAKALFFVTSAGFKGSAALDILTFSAKASQAGLGETEVVADLLTSTLGVYRDGSIDAKSATDQLTAAIREGKLEPRTLARSLATVLPFAETVGVEFGEVAGAMAAMSRQGIPAERSATALRGIFTKLIKPTEMGKKALKEVGLSIDDVRKTVREKGLLQGLRSLATAFDGNSDALAQVFEDSEAILGVLSLTGPAALENAGIIDRVTKAHGDLDKAIKPVTKTLEDQWARTVSSAGFVVKDLGERLKPVAERLLEIANRALEFYAGLGDGPKDFLATVLSLGPPLIGAAVGLKFASFFLGGLTPLLAGGTKAMGLFAGGLKAIAGAAAANPLLALILGLVALWIYWDEVTAAMDWAGKKFLELMRKWGVPIDDIFAWIGDAWDAAIDWIDTPLAWIFNWLADGIEGVFDWVEDAWTGVLDWFDGPGQDESIWSWLGEGISGPFRWVFTSWAGALDWLSAPARGVFAWLRVPVGRHLRVDRRCVGRGDRLDRHAARVDFQLARGRDRGRVRLGGGCLDRRARLVRRPGAGRVDLELAGGGHIRSLPMGVHLLGRSAGLAFRAGARCVRLARRSVRQHLRLARGGVERRAGLAPGPGRRSVRLRLAAPGRDRTVPLDLQRVGRRD